MMRRVLALFAALALTAVAVQATNMEQASPVHVLENGMFLHDSSVTSTPSLTPSFRQMKKSDDKVTIGLSTKEERAHYATLFATNTWKESKKYCKDLGYRLCTFEEICTEGKGAAPVGAGQLPEARAFTPIRSKLHGKNTWVRLNGKKKCTLKKDPSWGTKKKALRKGTKALVACCTTKKAQKNGAKAGVVQSRRITGERATKYAKKQKKLRKQKIAPRLELINPGVTLDGVNPPPAFSTARVWSDSALCDKRGARLHFTSDASGFRASSWCSFYGPSQSVPYTWLQMDFNNRPRKVRHVLIQGRADADQWVTNYRVQYSKNGKDWKYVKGTFAGNSDRNTVVKSPRIKVKKAYRFWRIVPVASSGYTSLRFALLAEPAKGGKQWKKRQLVLPGVSFDGKAPPKVSASSSWDENHDVRGARLFFKNPRHSHAWCAGGSTGGGRIKKEWIQIDFGAKKRAVKKVLIQGRGDAAQWVTKFRLAYSDDGSKFKKLKKVFKANSDQKTVVSVKIKGKHGRHRIWRIIPHTAQNHASLRFGLVVKKGKKGGKKQKAGKKAKKAKKGKKGKKSKKKNKKKKHSAKKAVVWGVRRGAIFVKTAVSRKSGGNKWRRVAGALTNVSIGPKGIVWGVNKKGRIYRRTGVSKRNPIGNGWERIPGALVQLSAGRRVVWGVNRQNNIWIRKKVSRHNIGQEWQQIPGGLTNISVGPKSVVWGVNSQGLIWRRVGIRRAQLEGSSWEQVPGHAVQVSVGKRGVWAVNSAGSIFYRGGVTRDSAGESWDQVDGSLRWIHASTNGIVWGVNKKGQIFRRVGVSKTKPTGKKWKQVKGNLKQLAVSSWKY